MTIDQFDSLGDRLDFLNVDKAESNDNSGNEFKLDISHRLEFIYFDEIIENSPHQSRTVIFDPDQYKEDKELLDSIQANGIKIPIIVKELEKDGHVNDPFINKKSGKRSFALVAGHRRVAAGQAAGLAGAKAVISKPTDDHEMLTLIENLGRRELTHYEKALAYKSIQEREGLSENKTAQITGVSQGEINRLFSSLNSPPILKSFWQEGSLSATAIVILKEYWHAIEQADPALVKEKIKGLSQSDAKGLRNQLRSGTLLETALISMKTMSDSPSLSIKTKSVKQSQAAVESKGKPNVIGEYHLEPKDAMISAIRDIFPKINKEKGNALYDYTIVCGVNDIDVFWAAALFASRGGKLDTAMNISMEVMSNRSMSSLINRQVKLAKQSASLYNKYWKKNKDIKLYLKTVFR